MAGIRGRRRGSAEQDRWSRRDWWGVVLDSPDPGATARFYSDLLGWPVGSSDETDADLDAEEGVGYLSFQRNPDYVRPTWPPEPGRQQMMMHLDFEVTDLAEAAEHAVELGAALAEHQPQDDVRVMLDPDGRPFCLYEHGDDDEPDEDPDEDPGELGRS